MKLFFEKYQATGNDFIMIDFFNHASIKLTSKQIKKLCDRRFGIGADGLIYLTKHKQFDFEMHYFNADGKRGSMCGNGGRCSVMFAKHKGIIVNKTSFVAYDGIHEAEIISDKIVRLGMKDVKEINTYKTHFEIDTGSPHYVVFKNNVSNIDVFNEGRKVRYSKKFSEKGINVNFAEIINENKLLVRTYERGVEDETLSCGTGVTACAISYMEVNKINSAKILITTPGGNLKVEAKRQGNYITNIFLTGPAIKTFEGYTLI